MHHLASALRMFFASIDHGHAIIHVLDDMEGGVDAGGFGKGFYEGIVPFMVVKNLENILVSTV